MVWKAKVLCCFGNTSISPHDALAGRGSSVVLTSIPATLTNFMGRPPTIKEQPSHPFCRTSRYALIRSEAFNPETRYTAAP